MNNPRGTKRKSEQSLEDIALQTISEHKDAIEELKRINAIYAASIAVSNKLITESNIITSLLYFMKNINRTAREAYIISKAIDSCYYIVKHGFTIHEADVNARKFKACANNAYNACIRIQPYYESLSMRRENSIADTYRNKELFEIAKNNEARLGDIAQIACDNANENSEE